MNIQFDVTSISIVKPPMCVISRTRRLGLLSIDLIARRRGVRIHACRLDLLMRTIESRRLPDKLLSPDEGERPLMSCTLLFLYLNHYTPSKTDLFRGAYQLAESYHTEKLNIEVAPALCPTLYHERFMHTRSLFGPLSCVQLLASGRTTEPETTVVSG
jgi:hypothetical protein